MRASTSFFKETGPALNCYPNCRRWTLHLTSIATPPRSCAVLRSDSLPASL